MKKNVCFISIFDLTKVQYEQSTLIQARGHNVYWITTDKKWTKYLLDQAVTPSDVLELVFREDEFLSQDLKSKVIEEIVEAERNNERTFNMALIADRFVISNNNPNINDLLCLYFFKIKSFLTDKKINVVFAEPTNTNEMVAAIICKQLKIPFLYPQHLRLPSDRFFFELGIASGRMISSGAENTELSGADFLFSFKKKNDHPSYFHLNNRKSIKISTVAKKIKSRFTGFFVRHDNLTHHRLVDRVSIQFSRVINSIYINYFLKHDDLSSVNGDIAFFGLHVQPEASIDVISPYFSDQLKLIKDIRRALPINVTLVVKEHPNFLGLKSIGFFQQLKKIPNVSLVHPKTSSFEIYKKSKIVLTVSGTSAYEAAMLGIPSIVFAKMFFGKFPLVNYCSNISELKDILQKNLASVKSDEGLNAAVMDEILSKSYAGYWTDPLSDPLVMSEENLNQLSIGFIDVIENALDKIQKDEV